MKAILIPVKRFENAKKRLAAHFSQSERAALAAALCEDFFAIVVAVSARVFVISAEERVLSMAQARGWEAIFETEQISESHSVDAASRYCAGLGVTHLL